MRKVDSSSIIERKNVWGGVLQFPCSRKITEVKNRGSNLMGTDRSSVAVGAVGL